MNTYHAMYGTTAIEVESPTSYGAQLLALPIFQKGQRKKVRASDITVWLVAKGGEQVVHSTGSIG